MIKFYSTNVFPPFKILPPFFLKKLLYINSVKPSLMPSFRALSESESVFGLNSICLILVLLLSLNVNSTAQVCDPNTHSLRFDGNSYIAFPPDSDLDISGDITVEAWIKIAAFAPSYVQGSIVCKHGWTSGEKGYVLRTGANGILSFTIAGIDDNGNHVGWKEVKSQPGSLQLNTWHHVAGTYDGKKLELFIDGIEVATKNFKGSIDPSVNYDLKIGRIADNNTFDKRYFTGLIDEVRIWKTHLSQNDIESNMDIQINPSSPNLVAYWRFNDGSGTTASDMCNGSINGNIITSNWDTDVPFTNGIPRPVISLNNSTLTSSVLTGNQWNLDGVPIPGASGISYSPTLAGSYTVTADYGQGCIATSDPFIIVNSAIDETNTLPFLIIKSSPGIIELVPTGQPVYDLFIRVIDVTGKEIYRSNDPNLPVCLSERPGIYLLSLEYNGERRIIKLIQN